MEGNQPQLPSKNGGKRAGAGRKPGSLSKKSREIAEKAAASGITPLEVMLQTMTAFLDQAKTAEAGEQKLQLMVEASKVAKDAAPYIHPRLNSIEHKGAIGGIEGMTDAELDARVEDILRRREA